jgi:hypothetical protein
MGGTIESITRTQNSSKAFNDLEVVHCNIDLLFGNKLFEMRTSVRLDYQYMLMVFGSQELGGDGLNCTQSANQVV